MAYGAAPVSTGKPLSLRDRLTRRAAAMKIERSSWDSHVRDVFDQTRPRRTRFSQTQVNKGDRRNYQIIDNTGVLSSRVLTSGLVNGLSSPASNWFRYECEDMSLREYGPVKDWIGELERLVRRIFEASNVYEALPTVYEELGLAGTGCAIIEDDFDDVIRLQTFTWGEYYLACNARRVVDTLYRETKMSVMQCVQNFGLKNCSTTVKTLYDTSCYDTWVDVMHAIEPNQERDLNAKTSANLPWRSIYWEPACSGPDQDKFLRKSGYRTNPIIAPRWDVVGNDVYGSTCPGMEALGDMRQLQIQQKRKGEGIDKQVRPATQGPTSLAQSFVNTLPGAHNTVASGSNEGIRPIYQVQPNLKDMNEDIKATQGRVEEAFFVSYILAISRMEGVQPKNQMEILERKGEGLLVLGSVVPRLVNDLFNPLHDRVLDRIYDICVPLWEMGEPAMLPPPPPELQGAPIKVSYISPLAQIQKQQGVAGIERLIGIVAGVAEVLPAMVNKIDGEQAVDDLADMLGVTSKMIRGDDAVAAIAEQQAQQQQAQQMAAMAAPAKDATAALKNLSDAKVSAGEGEGQGALENILGNMEDMVGQEPEPVA